MYEIFIYIIDINSAKKILILCFSFYFSIALLGLFLRGQLLEVIKTLRILWVVLRK